MKIAEHSYVTASWTCASWKYLEAIWPSVLWTSMLSAGVHMTDDAALALQGTAIKCGLLLTPQDKYVSPSCKPVKFDYHPHLYVTFFSIGCVRVISGLKKKHTVLLFSMAMRSLYYNLQLLLLPSLFDSHAHEEPWSDAAKHVFKLYIKAWM